MRGDHVPHVRLTCVSTKARRRRFRNAMMIAPLPPVRGGPWTEIGFSATSGSPFASAAAKAARSPTYLDCCKSTERPAVRCALVPDRPVRLTERRGRGREDHPYDALAYRCVDDVLWANDVHPPELAGIARTVGVDAGDVVHDLTAGHRAHQRVAIQDIPARYLHSPRPKRAG